jgi:hypothetical protein
VRGHSPLVMASSGCPESAWRITPACSADVISKMLTSPAQTYDSQLIYADGEYELSPDFQRMG